MQQKLLVLDTFNKSTRSQTLKSSALYIYTHTRTGKFNRKICLNFFGILFSCHKIWNMVDLSPIVSGNKFLSYS